MIYWNFAAYPTAWVLSDWLLLLDTVTAELAFIITAGVALSLILVSHSLFKHKLENMSLIKNPIKLIVRVLCYARKHKYPENRSALTYWEEEAPSRLDLGKDKYGGPFTEEEVEDVKTFFRILPLFIATIGFTSALFLWQPLGKVVSNFSGHYIIFKYHGAYHITVLLLFFIYQFIIRGCFHKYIPSMLTRINAGLVFALLGCITQLLVHIFASYDFILIIRQMLFGITCFLIYPTSLEFTVAQSPEYMRGMMVGLCYSSMGIGSIIAFMLLFLIEKWQYYYIITISCAFQLLILVVFVILAKRYKYRVRENEVNIVQIVDDHYQRYMEQEDEYKRHKVTLENEANYVIND
uniref:Major facilitator superfamily (MFS) profile domain-containing protein n=1 Tax=Amphimedon queenslandica TaxID=400682 RepID=A0A1X7SN40_AMPQE